MKFIRLVLIVFIAATSIVACKKESKKEVSTEIENAVIGAVSMDELEALGNDIQLLDVRTPDEYADGYIKNATNINVMGDNFLEGTALLDKSKPVYVYCKAGVRSAKAAKILRDAGFTEIYDYSGGFGEWISEEKMISID